MGVGFEVIAYSVTTPTKSAYRLISFSLLKISHGGTMHEACLLQAGELIFFES